MSALTEAVTALAAMGGLGGLASVITSLTTLRRHSNAVQAVEAEMRPDHGASLRDAVDRIEHGLDTLREDHQDLGRRLGHEIGEVRRDLADARRDHDERLRVLERP